MATFWLRTALGSGACLMLGLAYERLHSADVMAQAASNFLASLTPEQRLRSTFAFEDEERFNWHFVPRPRKGLSLQEMTPTQKHLAYALLSAGLSRQGYLKATTIMSLEEVLRILENDDGRRRNPEGYFFSIFGHPSSGPWGFRIEGHHLSLNFTIVGRRLSGSPNFLGANPAEIRHGPRKGLRTLAREEDLARNLVEALSEEQRRIAIVDKVAYPDILTSASRKAALKGQPSGLSITAMTARQRELLTDLVAEYADNLAPEMAHKRMQQLQQAGTQVFFAWAGGTERGQPHYYRIQTPSFLIEYDNTQDNANHIHSVWRDLEGDFGLDLLGAHYESSHR
ncbi:MAG: DUF3500 domain-containing protein [Bryobacteraceae bacterium]|nr:DUF3500 domain-containing protein [Bryobacteraceae bacterium]